jgi:hypothetical protein
MSSKAKRIEKMENRIKEEKRILRLVEEMGKKIKDQE